MRIEALLLIELQLLGFDTRTSEYITLGNYTSYFFLMTLAWLLIDALGRRKLLIQGSVVLSISFLILAVFGGLSENSSKIDIPVMVPGILGSITLFIATGKCSTDACLIRTDDFQVLSA